MKKRTPALSGLLLATVVIVGGCVSSRARDWAQTAPAMPPDESSVTPEDVHLGVWPATPARHEQF